MTMNTDRESQGERTLRVPPVDVIEREDGMVLLADLPGVDEDGLTVQVEQQVLWIEGRRSRLPEGARVHLDELGEGDFYREFRLSDDLDVASIQASLRDGVLRLQIPKSEHLRPRSIPIRTE
jgi:HSP20 family protein